MNDQWIRKFGLFVVNANNALDLSDMHVRFETQSADFETPNNGTIRVYNLSRNTIQFIQKGEFSTVVLNAGYENGNYGVIFQGTIKQFRIGKETNTDTYLDILAADGDIGYNTGFVNTTVAKGTTLNDSVKAAADAMPQTEIPDLNIDPQHIPTIRGQALFGMPRLVMRNIATTLDKSWSIQNGQIIFNNNKTYDPNNVVEINAGTGLIGVPEQVNDGIRITCLLNSRLRIGTSVKINNDTINQLIEQNPNNAPVPYNQRVGLYSLAPLSKNAIYKIIVIEHVGDTRGNNWYSNIIALDVDQSANSSQQVKGS